MRLHNPHKSVIILIGACLWLAPDAKAQSSSHANDRQPGAQVSTYFVKGFVSDNFGAPQSGVLVSVKGQTTSVLTDQDGNFRINAIAGNTLVFTHPNFFIAEHKVGRDTAYSVRLAPRFLPTPITPGHAIENKDTIILSTIEAEKLDVLYGQQDRNAFLGAISTVGSEQLNTTPASGYLYALQGRMAGLDINQTAGFQTFNTNVLTSLNTFIGTYTPTNGTTQEGPSDNSEFNVTLRGHAGSYGQNPIAIVDGVQREWYNIDPESIESISILKDPLSNIFLGQNSSRGAIIVTTKQATPGPTRLDITAETGTQQALGLPTPLPAYQYAYLLNEALSNNGKPTAYSEQDFEAYRNHTDPIGHPDVNWYNTILNKNPTLTRVNLNAAGGSNIARFMINLSYMNKEGMFVNSPTTSYSTDLGVQRYTMNTKIDVNVNRHFEVELQAFGRLQDGNMPGVPIGTIFNNLLSTPNNAYPVYNPNGSFGGNPNYTQNLLAQVIGSGYIPDHNHDLMTNLNLKYNLDQVTKGLWVKASGDVSVQGETQINRSLQQNVYQMAVTNGDTSYNQFGSAVAETNSYNTASWARYRFFQFGAGYDHSFHGQQSIHAEVMADQKRTLFNYDLPAELTNFAGKVSYNYEGKYFAEGAANYSGYDRYAPGHRFGLFYAGGLGWLVSKEQFFKELFPWVDNFKMRATYGLTGNANVDDYGYFIWREQYYSTAGTYGFGSGYNLGQANVFYEGGIPPNQTLANSNATWERAHKFDYGVDLAFLHNTLLFTGDYYHEIYFDVMQQRGDNVALVGINYPAENLGKDLYQGAEVDLTYQNRVGNFNYFISGNASVQQTKVLYMDEQYEQNSWNVHTGRPVGQPFGYIADGLFQTAAQAASAPTITGYTPQAGDIRYKDLNGDGVIDQFDVAPLGKGRPMIYYGLTAGFNFMGFEASALLQGEGNRDEILNNSAIYEGLLSNGNVYTQGYQQILGRWIPENAATATAPRLTAGGNGYNYSPGYLPSSYFLHNGNFWRLKNVSIGYNLPYSWLKRAKMGSVKIFVSGQNLFTHVAYKGGVDPEVELPNYPIQRVLNAGVKVRL
jgi:TonB-linked SusC/RagA family outer membrane protein